MNYSSRQRSRQPTNSISRRSTTSNSRDRRISTSTFNYSNRDKSFSKLRPIYQFNSNNKLANHLNKLFRQLQQVQRQIGPINTAKHVGMVNNIHAVVDKTRQDVASDPLIQRKIVVVQLSHLCKQLQNVDHSPLLKVKFQIAKDLLQADNLDSCLKLLDQLLHRPTCPKSFLQIYQNLIVEAGQLAIKLTQQERIKQNKLKQQQQRYNKFNKLRTQILHDIRQTQLQLMNGGQRYQGRGRQSVRSNSNWGVSQSRSTYRGKRE